MFDVKPTAYRTTRELVTASLLWLVFTLIIIFGLLLMGVIFEPLPPQ